MGSCKCAAVGQNYVPFWRRVVQQAYMSSKMYTLETRKGLDPCEPAGWRVMPLTLERLSLAERERERKIIHLYMCMYICVNIPQSCWKVASLHIREADPGEGCHRSQSSVECCTIWPIWPPLTKLDGLRHAFGTCLADVSKPLAKFSQIGRNLARVRPNWAVSPPTSVDVGSNLATIGHHLFLCFPPPMVGLCAYACCVADHCFDRLGEWLYKMRSRRCITDHPSAMWHLRRCARRSGIWSGCIASHAILSSRVSAMV